MIRKSIQAASLVMAVAFAAPAFAGEAISNDNLADILVKKGIISKDEAKAASKSKDGKLTLGGKAFISATSTKTKTNGAVTSKAKSFNIDRFYIDAKYHIDDTWMARFTSDVNTDNNLAGKKTNVFLKYAYIEGKFNEALQLRLGLSHNPWIDYEQHLWKHRFVAKVGADHYKFDDSADYGVGLKGSLVDGMVDYWVTIVNGGGYGNPTNTNNTFDYDSRLTVHPVEGADISAQYRSGYRNNATATAANVEKLMQFMGSYGTHDYRLGANYMSRKTGTTTTKDDKTVSVWGWAKFADQYGAFARYDDNKVKPTAGTSYHDKRYVAGAEFFAAKGMTYSLAWTGTNNTNTKVKSDVIGLYSEFKW